MKPFGALLPFEQAKAVVEANIRPITRVETVGIDDALGLSLIHISEPTRLGMNSYAVFCVKKKKK